MMEEIHSSWREFFALEIQKGYWVKLWEFLAQEYERREILPRKEQILRVFEEDLNEIKVVILGQDPYYTPDTAEGLAFSVRKEQKIPPSLRNIYKEIERDLGVDMSGRNGSLKNWAEQGVFLLNNVLTVEAGKAGSHRGRGWEEFTEAVVRYLSQNREGLAFLLWGNDARRKVKLIDEQKHLVLMTAHPSPLSAHRGFLGCGYFGEVNEYLKSQRKAQIEW